ncbi:helix-turn-helix domain-containing protein [Novosphingobium panipatense]|uniref:DNA-binding transcriptional regulator, MarR family n=1 Tax=Novosphingobium panipatense TaxID=428991 RepID=A0ABY1Q3U4_9SPHN|nr:hypothetical protein [Novosphingobium panipatense]SMP58307.1 DNA-binding transcriptional regulator, MarR family [Novosphingobium panipatense]
MTEEELKIIAKADRLNRLWRTAIDPLVPTQVVEAFLKVAQNEGVTLTELADKLGTNVSTASRQLLDLGERNRKREPGYQLVTREPDPMNLRTNRYSLTPKGRLLAQEVVSIMKE